MTSWASAGSTRDGIGSIWSRGCAGSRLFRGFERIGSSVRSKGFERGGFVMAPVQQETFKLLPILFSEVVCMLKVRGSRWAFAQQLAVPWHRSIQEGAYQSIAPA